MVIAAIVLLTPGFDSAPKNIHGAICRDAAKGMTFSKKALDAIVDANFHQDKDEVTVSLKPGEPWIVPNDKYRPEHHFDRNEGETHAQAFYRGVAFVREQEAQATSFLNDGAPGKALASIGRATHALQDFYSHSNFIDMTEEQQTQIQKVIEGAATDAPAELKITGYSKKDGDIIKGDDYSHDEFCKDGIVDLGIKKIVHGESDKPHPQGKNKHEVARAYATAATAALYLRVKAVAGAAWSKIEKF